MLQSRASSTARRIVAINQILLQSLRQPERELLTEEQRRLWNAEFPGTGYEEIARLAH